MQKIFVVDHQNFREQNIFKEREKLGEYHHLIQEMRKVIENTFSGRFYLLLLLLLILVLFLLVTVVTKNHTFFNEPAASSCKFV